MCGGGLALTGKQPCHALICEYDGTAPANQSSPEAVPNGRGAAEARTLRFQAIMLLLRHLQMALASIVLTVSVGDHASHNPGVLLWSGAALAARRADTTKPATVAARKSLLALADAALLLAPDPVTDKQVVPPSGDLHDYWSVSSYDWPCNVGCNRTLWSDCSHWCMPPFTLPFLGKACVDVGVKCNASSGLPWISHDGFPRSADKTGRYLHGDRPRADQIVVTTATLVLGWWFSPPEEAKAMAYLQRAVLLLRNFFLEKATRMNPNMAFAQGTPGLRNGTAYGTADFGRFKVLLDAVRLVESDAAFVSTWTQADRAAFRAWTSGLLDWWTSGCDGCSILTHNIGDNWDCQAMDMALYVGNSSAARAVAERNLRRRVDRQINGSGMLPLEDGRSNSFGYHTGTVLEFLDLALLGARASSVDLLDYNDSATGGSVTSALDFMEPVCGSNGTLWPFPMSNNSGETIETVLPECRLLFHRASLAYPARKERYLEVSRASGDKSSGPYAFWTLGLSMLDFIELVYTI